MKTWSKVAIVVMLAMVVSVAIVKCADADPDLVKFGERFEVTYTDTSIIQQGVVTENGYLIIKGKSITLRVDESGKVTKHVNYWKTLDGGTSYLSGGYLIFSNGTLSGQWSTASVTISQPKAKKPQIWKTLGKFQLSWVDEGYLEVRGENANLRVWECGRVDKREWKEINPNEQ